MKILILLLQVHLFFGINFSKCMRCKYMMMNYNNIYQSKCRYYTIYNNTYYDYIFDSSFSYNRKNYLSVQDALIDDEKCGKNQKNFKPIIDY